MESRLRFLAEPGVCGYLPDRLWQMEYELVTALSPAEYQRRMLEGWRRFGRMLFRPQCPSCTACRALRVDVAAFRPDRSQRRARRRNEGEVTLRIGPPRLTRAKLALYDRYHAFQADAKGWPDHGPKDAAGYRSSFLDQPFAVEEWCYRVGGRLVGVGYVDAVLAAAAAAPAADAPGRVPLQMADGAPLEGGLSAIYFFYDPDERERSLGTWNVLSVIAEARRRGLPWAYLGYHVEGCSSLEYKAGFAPNEARRDDGSWAAYRP